MSGGNDNNLIRNFFQYSGVKNCIFFKVISHGHQDYSLNKIIFFLEHTSETRYGIPLYFNRLLIIIFKSVCGKIRT